MSEQLIGDANTVLLVDDDEGVRDYMETVLEMAGYRVIVATDGEEALTKFKECDEIALVLTDLVMPNKNGRELINDIKEIRPAMKVIIMSSYASDIIDWESISKEGIDFVSKPIRIDVDLPPEN